MKKNYPNSTQTATGKLNLNRINSGRSSFSFMYMKIAGMLLLMAFVTSTGLYAQSVVGSPWDSGQISTTSPGWINWGSGVISLTDTTTNPVQCSGGAAHETTSLYNPTTGAVFNQCYKVFFGCPGNDNIGADANGDGMAFTFWKSTATWNFAGTTCGGGLGYDNAVSDLKAITIEFDTYSSQGGDNVDPLYGGGASGINDEIAVQINAETRNEGYLTSTNAGNLEDGKAHEVCITYTPATNVLTVSIDGVNRLTYNMAGNALEDYFGNVDLRQTWSAGKYGANNLQTISPSGTNMVEVLGRPFCAGQLPVSFLSFTAEYNNDVVLLNWATASEENNKQFIIERSGGSLDWHAIKVVDGAGNSSSILNYAEVDHSPLQGVSYYRIRQVDFDGTSSYSKVVAVKTGSEISVSPNPFDDVITINTMLEGEINVSIQDALGRLVYEAIVVSEREGLNIQPELPQGTYLITVSKDSYISQHKIIRK